MPDLKPPVVVITGASAGVGRAVVREFARDKAKIALIARGLDGLNGAAKEVTDAGGEAMILPLDVSDAAAVDEAAAKVEERFGPIDIWVNAAFAGVLSRFIDMSMEDYRRVTEVTYLGQVHGTHAALETDAAAGSADRSCWSDRRSPIAASRCNRPIAGRSTRSRVSTIRSALN